MFHLLLAFLLAPAQASEAEELLRAGRVADALPVARAEAESAPSDLDAHERYIDILMTASLFGVAQETYEERAREVGDADSWYLLGRALPTADAARTAYERALELDAEHPRAHMGLGAILRAEGRIEEAVSAYQESVARDPTVGEAWAGLAAAQLGLGQQEEALASARQAVTHVPGEPEGYLLVAMLAPDEGLAVLQEAARRIPGDARVHAALAEHHLDAGDGAAAQSAARQALTIDASRTDAGLSLLFATSMAEGTLDAEGYRGLIEARALEEEDPRAARTRYDELVETYPDTPLTHMGRARVRMGAGNRSGAIEDLGEAMKLDPANVEASAALGLAMLEEGRTGEARLLLRRATQARPGDVSLAVAAATASAASGRREEATGFLEASAEVRPHDGRIPLTHAQLLEQAGEREEAHEVLREALLRIPQDDRLILALATSARHLGRIEEAVELLEILAERSGNDELRDLARRLQAGELGR